ncbi:MAG TPA: phosphatase [Actinomycetota bacterium]|nr:phosphatase [Actinomycetota bacterium]
MDVIAEHAAQLPQIGDRWGPHGYARDELRRGLLEGRIAGPEVSHAMDNVRRNIGLLVEGDPDKLFGLSGVAESISSEAVLELVGRASGFVPDPGWQTGPVPVDPDLVLDACEAVGDRLAELVRIGGNLILATGHPTGLAHLYIEVGRELRTRGVKVIQPYEAVPWREPGRHHRWEVRYLEGVAMLTDGASMKHTHRGEPMARMLAERRPDLVFADHGFAGAAIERGVPTVSIADINDPALLVARAQGRTDTVIVMDDNVRPQDYWPCFQAIVARLP